jgi:hypothetical protein
VGATQWFSVFAPEANVDLKDWLTLLATLLSPLVALQVSRVLADSKQAREEQLRIFKTLMSTRAANLDPRHVECLNLIDVVFHSNARKEVEIRRLWKQYLDHLSDKGYPKDSWGSRRVELLVELLHAMAVALGFDFDKTHIKNQCYYPDGYGDFENDQGTIRRSLAEILSGRRPLPMWVANLPPAPQGQQPPVT